MWISESVTTRCSYWNYLRVFLEYSIISSSRSKRKPSRINSRKQSESCRLFTDTQWFQCCDIDDQCCDCEKEEDAGRSTKRWSFSKSEANSVSKHNIEREWSHTDAIISVLRHWRPMWWQRKWRRRGEDYETLVLFMKQTQSPNTHGKSTSATTLMFNEHTLWAEERRREKVDYNVAPVSSYETYLRHWPWTRQGRVRSLHP